jgi:hypothetical protein
MFVGLSLDQAPPYKAPIRFFLVAPIFAIIAGIFALFSSNYQIHNPNIIATIHLITIGFIIMTILGALQQMLPVIAGAVIPKAKKTAEITYGMVTLGLVAFTLGFLLYEKIFFFLAAFMLGFGLLYFTGIALFQLFKVKNKSYIVKGIIIALLFFILAFLIGIHLIIANATSNITELHYDLALIHYNYIFFGFLFILIVSLTIQVVPMFWVASAYKKNEQALLIIVSTLALLFYPINLFLDLGADLVYKGILTLTIIYFVFLTIKKLRNRKRKLKDITVYFYMTSMIFLLIGSLYWLSLSFFELPINILGILFGLGFIVSLMNGMLYKIVPFLTWFHLNAKGLFDIPTMREMIPIKKMQMQYYFHIASVIIFIIGFLFDINIIIKSAVILFIVSNILLFINIYNAVQIYRKNYNREPTY